MQPYDWCHRNCPDPCTCAEKIEDKYWRTHEGPGKRGPCSICGEEMGNEGGEYWHMSKKT